MDANLIAHISKIVEISTAQSFSLIILSLIYLYTICRGFSLIDLAENVATRRCFAIKRITCHSIEDQNIALREIENCRKIDSENVIRVIDYELNGQADIVINTTSSLFIVLPYYKHGSLADHLQMRAKKQDHMPEAQILQIFLGVCEGLRAIHETKPVPLAHRDLKTANICLSDSFEPIIVDLGSMTEARLQICGQSDAQRLQDEAEERSSIVYRAPELFTVKTYCTIDERTDIWASTMWFYCKRAHLTILLSFRVSAVCCTLCVTSTVRSTPSMSEVTALLWPCSVAM